MHSVYLKTSTDSDVRGDLNAMELMLLSEYLDHVSHAPLAECIGSISDPCREMLASFRQEARRVSDSAMMLANMLRLTRDPDEGRLEQSATLAKPAALHVEAWRQRYAGRNEFVTWAEQLPGVLTYKLGCRQDYFSRVASENALFFDAEGGCVCLDVFAPGFLTGEPGRIYDLLSDDLFPAFASADMLNNGRLVIVPTQEALRRMSEISEFRHGVYGFCSYRKGEQVSSLEHLSGVRAVLPSVVQVALGRAELEAVLWPDIEDIEPIDADAVMGELLDAYGHDIFF